MKSPTYHETQHYPPYGLARSDILTAVRVALRFGEKIPEVRALRQEFGMSRATAYRWRAAFIEARYGAGA